MVAGKFSKPARKAAKTPKSAGRGGDASRLIVPADERQRMAAAVAYFKAARYRDVGAGHCRVDDESEASMELDTVFRRHQVRR